MNVGLKVLKLKAMQNTLSEVSPRLVMINKLRQLTSFKYVTRSTTCVGFYSSFRTRPNSERLYYVVYMINDSCQRTNIHKVAHKQLSIQFIP